MRNVFIYALADPFTSEIRYVGKSVDPPTRLRRHLGTPEIHARTHKAKWLRSVLKKQCTPVLMILEATTEGEWESRERWWIKEFLDKGVPLTNSTPGGDGRPKGFKHDEIARQKIIAALKKRKVSDETREKMAQAQRGKVATQTTRDACSVAAQGRWDRLSADEKAKKVASMPVAPRAVMEANGRAARGRKAFRKNSSSLFVGVSWNTRRSKWRTTMSVEGHSCTLGYFADEVEAACAYDKKAVEVFGQDAATNEKLLQSYLEKLQALK